MIFNLFKKKTPVITKPVIFTEAQVKNHFINSHYIEFMCKNCGKTYNSLSVNRNDENYCTKCNCWICDDCKGNICSECNEINNE